MQSKIVQNRLRNDFLEKLKKHWSVFFKNVATSQERHVQTLGSQSVRFWPLHGPGLDEVQGEELPRSPTVNLLLGLKAHLETFTAQHSVLGETTSTHTWSIAALSECDSQIVTLVTFQRLERRFHPTWFLWVLFSETRVASGFSAHKGVAEL